MHEIPIFRNQGKEIWLAATFAQASLELKKEEIFLSLLLPHQVAGTKGLYQGAPP
jgi:hypothetical protein